MSRVEIDHVVIDQFGAPVSGATVQVNSRDTGFAAVVYSAEIGVATLLNPLRTILGRIEGWLEEGSYNLIVTPPNGSYYIQPFEAVSGTTEQVLDITGSAIGNFLVTPVLPPDDNDQFYKGAGASIVRFPSGKWNLTYRSAQTHEGWLPSGTGEGGLICKSESFDDANDWTHLTSPNPLGLPGDTEEPTGDPARTIYAEEGVDLAPVAGLAPDGAHLIVARRVIIPAEDVEQWLPMIHMRSPDEGENYSDPVEIPFQTGDTMNFPFGRPITIADGLMAQSYYWASEGDYPVCRGGVRVALTEDMGISWPEAVMLHDNGSPAATMLYSETSLAHLGGGYGIAMVRDQRDTRDRHTMFLTEDNFQTFELIGTTEQIDTWDLGVNHPAELSTYHDHEGRLWVSYFWANRTDLVLRRIDGLATDLIDNGVDGWNLNTKRKARSIVGDGGYPTMVHPFDDGLAFGTCYINGHIRFISSSPPPAIQEEQTGQQTPLTNLVENPSLEIDAVGWEDGSSAGGTLNVLSRSTAWFEVGAASLRFKWTNANDADPRNAWVRTLSGLDGMPVEASGLYSARARVNIIDSPTVMTNARLRVNWYDAAGAFIEANDGPPIAETGETGEFDFTIGGLEAPAEAVFAALLVGCVGLITPLDVVEFHVDVALFAASPDVPDYHDGDSDDADWLGTPHNSISLRTFDLYTLLHPPRRLEFLAATTGAWTNMPAALAEVYDNLRLRRYADLRRFSEACLQVNTAVAGVAGSVLAIQYSLDGGTNWAYLDGVDGPKCAISGTAIEVKLGVYAPIVAAAKMGEILLRVVGIGGDGVVDPNFYHIGLLLR